MEKIPSINELLSAFFRHIIVLAAVVVAGFVFSVFYALGQPRLYQTQAVVQIEQPRLQETLSGNATAGSNLQRLQIIEQRLMARDNLMSIITKLNLADGADDGTMNELVSALRSSVRIERITDPTMRWRSDVSPSALSFVVQDADPERAALIANEFLNNMLEQSRSSRAERVNETLEFFESEEQRVGATIADMDAQIAEFKRNNADALPESLLAQRTQLANLEDAELAIDREMIEGATSLRGDAAARAALRNEQLQEQKNLIQTRRALIEANIERAPQVEKSFASLNRQLQQLTDQFTIITRNRSEAEMGQMMENSSQTESFLVLETALIPEHPIAPDRRKIVLAGTMLSAIIGLGLVLLLELRNPVIRTASQMERQLGLRPVVSIPNIEKTRLFNLGKRTKIGIMVCGVLVLLALALS